MSREQKTTGSGVDFSIDGWVVRPSRGLIQRNGQEQRLKPKVMAVLQCLAAANGEVVTRDELFETVWPGAIVSDATLSQCIVELRQALGESAKEPRLVETVPKVGFRLTRPTRPLEAPSETTAPAGGRRLVFASIAAVLVLAVVAFFVFGLYGPKKGATDDTRSYTIAVLPFVDMSPEQDQGHLSDGLTEELIHSLSQIKELEVTGRTSSFMFKDRNEDLREVAQILGVRYLLEGSVRKSGEQLRVTANLIDARSGSPLWSDTYEKQTVDYFQLQDEIAHAVTVSVGIGIGFAETRVGAVYGTGSIEAYEEAMKAYAGKFDPSRAATLKAIEHLKRATEIDPGYAFAWAALSHIYVVQRDRISDDWQQLAREYRDRAEALGAEDPVVLRFAVFKHIAFEEWDEAEQALQQLIEIYRTPLLKEHLEMTLKTGRAFESVDLARRMLLRDPLNDDLHIWLQHAYLLQERYEEALEEAEVLWELFPAAASAQEGLITALNSRDREQIQRWLDRMLDYPEVHVIYQPMARYLDDSEAALQFLRQLEPQGSAQVYPAAMWAAWHGDPELSLQFQRMMPDPWSFWAPHNRDVRKLQGFKDLLIEMGLPAYWREYGWNDFCQPVGADDFVCE